mgnify:CR=1 FL=1
MSESTSAENLHLDDFTIKQGVSPVPKYYGEALVADFHVKAVTALLLERPGKRALHLEPVPGRAVHRRIVKPGGSKRTVPARGGNDRPVAVVRVL